MKFPRVLPLDEEGLPLPEEDEERYNHARRGDTLMVPFQCQLCHFRNLKGRNPSVTSDEDHRLLSFVKRANLDAFWSRTSATVEGNCKQVAKLMECSFVEILPARGPFGSTDEFGMGLAVALLQRSLDPGRNDDYVQYDTTRKLRSAFSNLWQASVHTNQASVMAEGRNMLRVTTCPSNSFWFQRFMRGFHERVGDLVKQNLGISSSIMTVLMEKITDMHEADTSNVRTVELGFYCMLCYLGALRGDEAFRVNLGECWRLREATLSSKEYPHVVVPLQGKFKTSTGLTCFLLFLSTQVSRRFKYTVGYWLHTLMDMRKLEEITSGWLYAKKSGPNRGQRLESSHFELDVLTLLVEVQEERGDLIPAGLDVMDVYGTYRSFRRGATTEARNAKVPKEAIELNNGWRTMEKARGKHPGTDMLAYYTELSLALKSQLVFSSALLRDG